LLVIFNVPPSAGSVIICGVMENSLRVTSATVGAADDAAAPADDPPRRPNIARNNAATANTTANQPRNDLSARSMRAMVTGKPEIA
jgi:hypothetical protein